MTSKPIYRPFQVKALCTAIVKLVHQDLEKRLKEKKIPLTSSEFTVLMILRRNSLTLQELSARMILAPATLIPIIDELEKKGFVKRGKDINDRRKNPLLVTSLGFDLIAKAARLREKNKLIEAVDSIGDKKADQLISLLEEVATSISGDKTLAKNIESITKNIPLNQEDIK